MADQQQPRPPTASLPLKKRAMDVESSSSDEEDPVDSFAEEFKKRKLQELQRKAFCSVVYAFMAETFPISHERYLIIQKLMHEWNISEDTYNYVAMKIKKYLENPQDFPEEEERPFTISHEEKAALSPSTSVPNSSSSWRRDDAESLIGKTVRVRLPLEEAFEDFFIKEYDAEQEMHRLESTDPNALEMDECLSWIDLREIPPEDIMWL